MPQPTHDRWWQIDATYSEALALLPEERAAFLKAACEGDAALRREVEQLLAAHEASEAYLEDPTDWLEVPLLPGLSAETEIPTREGHHVGSYRLLQEIGRGGMGTVYLAERADGQFHQRVALKLIRSGPVTEDVLRRFRLEREILAGLEHPHIARLLDGGVTEQGDPYFVMEYVAGTPITVHCDAHKLGIAERLRLFRTVCAAVHYAHQNLVVHRDLTPNNILVTEQGQVKLLDFGIAKLLDEASSPVTVPVTEQDRRLMTPEYASPEQVRGGAITTASDVYQLGVLLYELLTGHRPYHLPSRVLHEVERVICEEDPEKPSTVVTESETGAVSDDPTQQITPDAVSRARDTSIERLRRRLSGDLDNIVLMAMRKEPHRRYTSAEQLGEDIARHLGGMPVVARKDTLSYRASKFVRRHRLGVVGACVVALSLLGGLTVALWQARVASHERDAARQEATKSEQVIEFLVGVFEVADPGESRGDTLTAHEILDRGAERIAAELATQPAVQATMMDVMGRVYQNLGSYEEATSLLEEALNVRQRLLGPDHPEVAASLNNLAWLQHEKDDYEAADSLFRQALAMRRALLGEEHPDVAESLNDLARSKQFMGDYAAADSLLRQALAMRRRLLGETHTDVAESLNDLALLKQLTGDYAAADSLFRQALAMRRALFGEMHPDVALILSNRGWLLMITGDYAAADSLLRQALAIRRTLYGDDHPYVARSLSALAELLSYKGDYDAAEPLLRQALAIQRKRLGNEGLSTLSSLSTLAGVLHAQGDYDAAEEAYREVLAITERRGEENPLYINNLAALLKDKGDYAAAEALYRRAWTLYRAQLGDTHPFTAIVLGNVATTLRAQGAYDQAEPLYREALQTLRTAWSDDHPGVANVLVELGTLLMDRDDPQQAEPALREALDIRRQALPEGDGRTLDAQGRLGACLGRLQRYDEAESLLLESYGLLNDQYGDQHDYTGRALDRLIDLYQAWGKADDAGKYRALRAAMKTVQ